MVGVAVNDTKVPAQIVVLDAVIVTAGVTGGITVIVSEPVAVGEVTQAALLVNTQLTVLPVTTVLLEYVELLVPTGDPFRYHWKEGVEPPPDVLALKITFAPVQLVFPKLLETNTAGVTFVVTVVLMVLLDAVTGLGQVDELVM